MNANLSKKPSLKLHLDKKSLESITHGKNLVPPSSKCS